MAEFYPRLDKSGIYKSKYWYSDNPFYLAGWGLPNCTCYAWGRFYEISGIKPNLPLGNGGTWYPEVVEKMTYLTGATPVLGAIACYNSLTGGAGHVGVVEEIQENGDFIISQSSYYRPISNYPPDTPQYFDTVTCNGITKKADWMGDYEFQGFIYNPYPPIPPVKTKKKMPLWMYLRYF